MDEKAVPSSGMDAGKGPAPLLVTMIDMIGFGIVIPFSHISLKIWLLSRTSVELVFGSVCL